MLGLLKAKHDLYASELKSVLSANAGKFYRAMNPPGADPIDSRDTSKINHVKCVCIFNEAMVTVFTKGRPTNVTDAPLSTEASR